MPAAVLGGTAPRAPTRTAARTSWPIVFVLGYCGALVSITQTFALPVLPDLIDEFGVSVGDVSWVATSALLASAVANPVLGRLGDMFGKRRMMLVSLLALLAGSVLCALSTSLPPLVVGRAFQGVGIGVIPLGISIARDELPAERVSGGIALVSATMGIGGGLGLPLAGLVLHVFDWPVLFWMAAVLTVGGIAVAALVVPESPVRSPGHFDLLGAAWLSAVLIALLLPISKAPTWGWTSPVALALFAAAAVGGLAWARYERRPERPLVDVAVMRRRPVMLVNLAALLMGFAMFGNFYATLSQLQLTDAVPHGFGASVVEAGLVLLPGAVVMMAMSPISARISDSRGPWLSLLIGALVVGGGFVVRTALIDSLVSIAVGVAIVNCGIGIAYGAMPAVVMANVPESDTASANAANSLMRSVGASICTATTAAILGSMTLLIEGGDVASVGAFRLAYVLPGLAAFGAAALAWHLPHRGGLT